VDKTIPYFAMVFGTPVRDSKDTHCCSNAALDIAGTSRLRIDVPSDARADRGRLGVPSCYATGHAADGSWGTGGHHDGPAPGGTIDALGHRGA
jgi:hypothetical protein